MSKRSVFEEIIGNESDDEVDEKKRNNKQISSPDSHTPASSPRPDSSSHQKAEETTSEPSRPSTPKESKETASESSEGRNSTADRDSSETKVSSEIEKPKKNRSSKRKHDTNEEKSREPRSKKKATIRYFIIKSADKDDVDISMREGIWATQPRNEEKLNRAFKNTERVVLLFSVNNSKHFQGYAVMTSAIERKKNPSTVWLKPDGRTSWGAVFQVRWEKIFELSFRDTGHLKNSMNENLPVKRSRDGQELAPELGAKLIGMIDRGASGAPMKEGAEDKPDKPRSSKSRKEEARARRQEREQPDYRTAPLYPPHHGFPFRAYNMPYPFPMPYPPMYPPLPSRGRTYPSSANDAHRERASRSSRADRSRSRSGSRTRRDTKRSPSPPRRNNSPDGNRPRDRRREVSPEPSRLQPASQPRVERGREYDRDRQRERPRSRERHERQYDRVDHGHDRMDERGGKHNDNGHFRSPDSPREGKRKLLIQLKRR